MHVRQLLRGGCNGHRYRVYSQPNTTSLVAHDESVCGDKRGGGRLAPFPPANENDRTRGIATRVYNAPPGETIGPPLEYRRQHKNEKNTDHLLAPRCRWEFCSREGMGLTSHARRGGCTLMCAVAARPCSVTTASAKVVAA